MKLFIKINRVFHGSTSWEHWDPYIYYLSSDAEHLTFIWLTPILLKIQKELFHPNVLGFSKEASVPNHLPLIYSEILVIHLPVSENPLLWISFKAFPSGEFGLAQLMAP